MVVQAALLLPLAAIAYSLHQQRRYEASADVLLSAENLSATVPGAPRERPFARPGADDPDTGAGRACARGRPRRARSGRRNRPDRRPISSPTRASRARRLRTSSPSRSRVPTRRSRSSSRTPTRSRTAHIASSSTQDSIERALADVDERLQRLDRTGASLERSGRGAGLGALTAYGASIRDPGRPPADARVDAGASAIRRIGPTAG